LEFHSGQNSNRLESSSRKNLLCYIYIYLCIYKYLCIHTCIFIYKCICTHIYLSVYIIQIFACIDIPTMSHTNTRTYTYIHACYISCVHVHVYFFTCIIIYIFKSVQVNECMYIYDQLSMYAFKFECTFMFRHELWKWGAVFFTNDVGSRTMFCKWILSIIQVFMHDVRTNSINIRLNDTSPTKQILICLSLSTTMPLTPLLRSLNPWHVYFSTHQRTLVIILTLLRCIMCQINFRSLPKGSPSTPVRLFQQRYRHW